MGIYDGIYLYTDLDGTLLNDKKTIPEANMRAIEKFIENGGRFGIATGRSAHNLSFFPEVLPLNAPSILDNGGDLYDVRGRKYIDCTYIPREKGLEVVNRLIEISPTASVQVYTCDARYQVNLNPGRIEDPLVGIEGIYEPLCRAEDVPGEWIKIVICEPEELLKRTLQHLDIDALNEDFATVLSGKLYFEFFSLGMHKGRGIEAIRAKEPAVKKILAIGDYYNDLEMLQTADISAAPANAEQDIKDVVNFVVCDNNDDAVAEFLRLALGMEV